MVCLIRLVSCGVIGGALAGLGAEPEAAGRLTLTETNCVSLGVYPQAEDRTAYFAIKNTGQEPLRIVRVVTTCKCMRLDSFPKTLAPGEQGKVAITILRNEVSGQFERIFYIESDDPINPSIRGSIVGFATPLFDVSCDVPTSLGPVDVGLVWTGTYTVVSTETGLSLASPMIRNQGARCSFSILTNQQDHMMYTIKQVVTFEGGSLMESRLIFPVQGKAGEKPMPVQLVAEAVRRTPVKVFPEKITLSRAGTSVRRRLLLSLDIDSAPDLQHFQWRSDIEGIDVSPHVTKSGKAIMIELSFSQKSVGEVSQSMGAKLTLQYEKWDIDVPVSVAP